MGMRKSYGSYRTETCPFCGGAAYSKNKQGMAVCAKHKDSEMGDMKCACGEIAEMREGKWGTFFLCRNCGPLNKTKIMSVNTVTDKKAVERDKYAEKRKHDGKTETVVRSDDPFYFS